MAVIFKKKLIPTRNDGRVLLRHSTSRDVMIREEEINASPRGLVSLDLSFLVVNSEETVTFRQRRIARRTVSSLYLQEVTDFFFFQSS